jgi:hypothetical protein
MEEEKRKQRKGGRPPKEDKRTHQLGISLTSVELAKVTAKAMMAGLRPAVYIRQMAVDGKAIPLPSPADVQLHRDLTGAANNLNQLTKEAHQQNLLVIVPRLLKNLEAVNQLIQAIYDRESESR